MKTTKTSLALLTKATGLHVETWAPGDGMTRYRFFAQPCDYDNGKEAMYIALGRAEAVTFLRGVIAGQQLARNAQQQLRDALARVLDRMSTKAETLDDAIEAVYADFGDRAFARELKQHAQGQ